MSLNRYFMCYFLKMVNHSEQSLPESQVGIQSLEIIDLQSTNQWSHSNRPLPRTEVAVGVYPLQ